MIPGGTERTVPPVPKMGGITSKKRELFQKQERINPLKWETTSKNRRITSKNDKITSKKVQAFNFEKINSHQI